MARISKFQQRQLASSIVGTPGVDTSESRAFASIAGAAGQAANVFGGILVKRQEAADKASASDTLTDFEIAYQQAAQEQATEFAGTTMGPLERVELLKQKADALFQEFEGSLSTPNAKAIFTQNAQVSIRRRLAQEGKIASDNQVLVARDRMVTSQNKIAGSIYNFVKTPGLTYEDKKAELLAISVNGTQRNIDISKDILGGQEAKEFQKSALEMNFRAAIAGLLETAPEQAIVLLKDSAFKDILNVKERAALRKTAETRVKDFTVLLQRQEKQAIFAGRQDLYDKLQKGTLNLGEVEQIGDTKAQQVFRDALLKFKPLNPDQLAARSAELQIRWENLFKRERDGTLKNELKNKVTIDDIIEVQAAYMDALRDGVITKDRLIKAGGRIPALLQEAIDNKSSKPFNALIAALNAFSPVALMLANAIVGKDNQESNENRAELTDLFLDRFDKLDFEDSEAVTKAIKATITEFQYVKNRNRARYEVGDEVMMPTGLFKISGFDDDGEPVGDFV